MHDFEFAVLVDKTINKIARAIEERDQECRFDVDINDNILIIDCAQGTYVINKQSAVKELWLSSPISGPYHFIWQEESWLDKIGTNLFVLLSKELKIEI